jgi:hypothetical protein
MLEAPMLDQTLEALIAHATSVDGGADLARARQTFEGRTGAFEASEPWHEARIRFFFDWYLCEWDGGRVARALAGAGLDERSRTVAVACTRAERGLFEIISN